VHIQGANFAACSAKLKSKIIKELDEVDEFQVKQPNAKLKVIK
jgi:hypothetical protein